MIILYPITSQGLSKFNMVPAQCSSSLVNLEMESTVLMTVMTNVGLHYSLSHYDNHSMIDPSVVIG